MALDYALLNGIIPATLDDFILRYRLNPGSNPAAAYYAELERQAIAAGLTNVAEKFVDPY